MEIPIIPHTFTKADQIIRNLDQNGVKFHNIDSVNWPDRFPYKPQAEFRIVVCGQAFALHYRVKEEYIRAMSTHDNEQVCKDSCVEFFFMPYPDGIYYNIECNCIGTLKIAAGTSRHDRETALQSIMNNVLRWTSIPREPFDNQSGNFQWEIALIIPFATFFKHVLSSTDSLTAKGNFYKCGDALDVAHFTSWNPIALPDPDFHCPTFFGPLEFIPHQQDS